MILESRPLHKKKKRLAKNRSRDSSRDSSQSVSGAVGVGLSCCPLCCAVGLLSVGARAGVRGASCLAQPQGEPSQLSGCACAWVSSHEDPGHTGWDPYSRKTCPPLVLGPLQGPHFTF